MERLFFDLRANIRSRRMSSPIATVTRGPIHVIALIDETSPTQISAPTRRPPHSPKMCLPAITATSICPTIWLIGVV